MQALWCDIPIIAAMSIADPTYKWTLTAFTWLNQKFEDVNISDDGVKVVVAGSGYDSQNLVIVWVLNTSDGSVIS